jgi:outer membrane protein TolC
MLLSLISNTGRLHAGVFALACLSTIFIGENVHAEPSVPPPVITRLPAVLTLKNAIAIALRQQPSEAISKASVDSALGAKEQAKSQYFPTVTPSYTFQNNRGVEYGITQSTVSTSSVNPGAATGTTTQTSSFQTSSDNINVIRGGGTTISLKQTLLDSGQREQANAEARHQVDAASLNLADMREQIIANVTTNYYTLLEAQDLVKVAQALVTENQQTVDLTNAELSAGTAAQTDVYQAKANLATAQVSLIQNQNTVAIDATALKNAMGIVTADPIQPESLASGSDLPPAPASPAIATLAQYYQLAEANRNDLKAQVALVESSQAAVKLARINAGVSLSADYLLNYQPQNDIGPKGTDSVLTLTGSFPLFDGGYSKGAVRVADAALETSVATLEQTRQTIFQAVEEGYATRQEQLQAISYAQVAVDAAQLNYKSAVASREAGVGTVLEITTAEATLTQAQGQYVSAVYNYYIADSNLQRAAGLD